MSERVKIGRVAGADAKINDKSELTFNAGNGVTMSIDNNIASLSADTSILQTKLTGAPDQIVRFDANGDATVDVNPFTVELYGFELQMDESEPSNMIRYIERNKFYSPAHMNYSTGTFDYGDWGNAFFIKNLKPCMLNYNGTVAYDLDKNDYTKKADGTASDVANSSFAGNAMVGIPTVWVKIDTTVARKPKFYFSNKQLDANFKCYAHHDNDGNVMPYTYIAAYNGWVDSNNKLRSISGKTSKNTVMPCNATFGYGRSNNLGGYEIWDVQKFVDRQLINLLLYLIGRSTNLASVFGSGNMAGRSNPSTGSDGGLLYSGTLNDKGPFYGYTATNLAVKVFGIENWWGEPNPILTGITFRPDGYCYKLTYGTEDGTTVTGFNDPTFSSSGDAPEGLIRVTDVIASDGVSYINDMNVGDYGLLPKSSGATSSTKYCSKYVGKSALLNYEVALYGTIGHEVTMDYEDNRIFSFTSNSLSCKPNVNNTPEIYGFELDMDQTSPSSMINYIGDNAEYTPAGMDFTNGVFDYGDWGNAFFIKNLKPCMLNYNGTVAYDLDKNDYTKKADGTASDVANASFAGNAMMGIPTIWVKIDTTVARKPKFYFADRQVDTSYHAYAHHDNNGKIMPYTYMPIYDGWIDSNSKLRSLSGKTPLTDIVVDTYVDAARSINTSNSVIWDIEKFVDRELLILLTLLIGKSTDVLTIFGTGRKTSMPDIIDTGALNNKGLFFGYSESQTNGAGVKMFGIEHLWGNVTDNVLGIVNRGLRMYYKLTYGTEDGTTVTGFSKSSYALTASVPSGFIAGPTISAVQQSSSQYAYSGTVSDVAIGSYGILPITADTSSSPTKYGLSHLEAWIRRAGYEDNWIGTMGGCRLSYQTGILYFNFNCNSQQTWDFTGARVSCKPLLS